MRTRHRIPTIFTLSMLDVFCCALGCVILLWLWNERRAKANANALEKTRHSLESAGGELASARSAIEALNADLSRARAQIAALSGDLDRTRADLTAARDLVALRTRERDQARGELAAARSELADRAGELARVRGEAKNLADLLARKTKDQERAAGELAALLEKKRKDEAALKSQIAQAQKKVLDLEVLMRDRDKELTVASAKSRDLSEQLHDLDAQLKALRSKSDASLDEQGKRLAAADSRVKELEKFLNNRKSIMIDMQSKLDDLNTERKDLSQQLVKLRLAADNRFAGIQLSGRRVVFLVDMSGSMRMVDAKTEAADKWPSVVNTVVRVMKSLPDLEKFQIVLFSEAATFPLGATGDWLDYDAATSADKVRQMLAATEPKGNTNMYAAFEAAFRLRPRGLDTVYLLSDGLPNVGPGLSPLDQTREMRETERGEILGHYIRQMLNQTWNRPASGWAKVRINSIGFFYESPDLGAFLWALARENDGSFVGMSKP